MGQSVLACLQLYGSRRAQKGSQNSTKHSCPPCARHSCPNMPGDEGVSALATQAASVDAVRRPRRACVKLPEAQPDGVLARKSAAILFLKGKGTLMDLSSQYKVNRKSCIYWVAHFRRVPPTDDIVEAVLATHTERCAAASSTTKVASSSASAAASGASAPKGTPERKVEAWRHARTLAQASGIGTGSKKVKGGGRTGTKALSRGEIAELLSKEHDVPDGMDFFIFEFDESYFMASSMLSPRGGAGG